MQSKKDLYQIGEVARLFHLSISLLRHYDKTGLVTPEYTDPDTGYRYYSLRQFECLNTIRYLRALDMPLEEIADFLHNRDTGRIQELLSKQLVQVHKKQQELAVIEHQIKNRLNQIQGALSAHPGEIFLEKKAPLKLACMKKQLNPSAFGGPWFDVPVVVDDDRIFYRMEFVVSGGVVVNAGKLFDFAASESRIYHILILIFELRSFLVSRIERSPIP